MSIFQVYVGNLDQRATKHQIEDIFSKYGPLRNVWVARNPPGFAFVEYEDSRDAEDAVRNLDGSRACGSRIRVEMSSGRTRNRGGSDRRGGGGRDRRSNRFEMTFLLSSISRFKLFIILYNIMKKKVYVDLNTFQ